MYQSYFSYNITRHYPFRWFTLTVILGGIAATALISFLNVAATGYELYPVSSTDPNTTISESDRFSKWPAFLVSTTGSCQSTEIPLQAPLYTNNTALSYTLSLVWTIDKNGQKNMLESLVYKNQPIQSCAVGQISLDFNVDDRTAGQMALIPVSATVTAAVNCAIDDAQGRTYFQLTASYEPIPYGGLATQNLNTKASLYWGESIMRLYWANLMMQFYNSNVQASSPLYKGVVMLNRASTALIATVDEVSSIDFFSVGCFFNGFNSTGIIHDFSFCGNGYNNVSSLSEGTLMPSIWESVNILGKATYFTVLADLGTNNESGPNMLVEPMLLANLSQNLTTINLTTTSNFRWGLSSDLEQNHFNFSQPSEVNENNGSSGILGISPAVLVSNYLCQIPRLKTPGTLFVSVLVADLVLLQAIWIVFKLGVDTLFVQKRAELSSCEGCAKKKNDFELGDVDEGNEDERLVNR